MVLLQGFSFAVHTALHMKRFVLFATVLCCNKQMPHIQLYCMCIPQLRAVGLLPERLCIQLPHEGILCMQKQAADEKVSQRRPGEERLVSHRAFDCTVKHELLNCMTAFALRFCSGCYTTYSMYMYASALPCDLHSHGAVCTWL